ncbi:MAG: sensor histidine kinase [Nitrospinota bacterium]
MAGESQHEEENQKILEQIILGVAHELNNPNTFIRMNTVNIKKMFKLLGPCLSECEKKSPEAKYGPFSLAELRSRIGQHLESTLEATVRLISIAEKLKMCSSAAISETKSFSFKEVVDDTIVSHQFLLDELAHVRVLVKKDTDFVVSGYRLQLEQAVSALITNACHAMTERYKEESRKEGILEVSISDGPENVDLIISDNGIGMEKAVLQKAYTPYFTTKPQGIGDGLGLAICKAIMERHGGSITIDSKPGVGTKVIIELPKQSP